MTHRILIIDDEAVLRATWRDVLEEEGYNVMEACDGAMGAKQLQWNAVDLVITDMLMPRQEGMQTIHEIRKTYPNIKILAVSGGGATRNMTFLEAAQKLGADRTLAKPLGIDDLLQTVSELLSGDSAAA